MEELPSSPQIKIEPLEEKKLSRKKILVILGIEFFIVIAIALGIISFLFLGSKSGKKATVNIFEGGVSEKKSIKSNAREGYSQRILEIVPGIVRTSLIYAAKDGSHLSYDALASTSKGNVSTIKTDSIVVDGVIGNEYSRTHELAVNDKTHTVVYVGNRLGSEFAVINGVESRPYSPILGGPFISPDGKHTAYIGRKEDSKWVVLNGVERYKIGVKDSSYAVDAPAFSPDSKKLAFRIREIALDGRMLEMDLSDYSVSEGKVYEDVGDPIYSSTGRLAYRVQDKNSHFLVVDGQEGTRFSLKNGESIGLDPIFSSDGKHTAYYLHENFNGGVDYTYFVVLDNKRLQDHYKGSPGLLTFSNDNKNFSYTVDKTIYTYDVGTGKLISQLTPTPFPYPAAKKASSKKSFKLSNGQEYFISKSSNSDGDTGKYKYKLEFPSKGVVESDWDIKPVFSDDLSFFSVVTLRDNTAWYEEYDLSESKLKRMPEKPGYKIPQKALKKPSDDAIVQTAKVTASEDFTKFIFDYNFEKKEGSGVYVSIALNGDVVASLYEEDVAPSANNVVSTFEKKLKGEFLIKLYAEPIKKGAKSVFNASNFRFGN